jgi:Domain of unknown function (DUF4279)
VQSDAKGWATRPSPKKGTFSAGASFRIQGLNLPLNEIAQELRVGPTHTHRRGELGMLREPLHRDMWMLDSPLDESQELDLHLKWLAERLLPRKQYILSLKEKFAVDIYCYKTCYTEQASLTLSPHALKIFTELALELCVSLIFLPGDPEDAAEPTPPRAAQDD